MIRIISKDGCGMLSEFINTETGEDITKALAVEYGGAVTIDHIVSAKLTLCMVEVDVVVGHTEWHTKNPISGDYEPVSRIEFKDGTGIAFADDGTPVFTPPSGPKPLGIADAGLAP